MFDNIEAETGTIESSRSNSLDEAAIKFSAMDEDDQTDESDSPDDSDAGFGRDDDERLSLHDAAKKIADKLEEEDPTPLPERTYKVTVDGEEIEVPEAELVAGYSRHADYTRKTQAVAEERKALAEERDSYRAGLEQMLLFVQNTPGYEQHAQKLAEIRDAEFATHRDEYIAKERARLLEFFPSWTDEAIATRESDDLVNAARDFGFDDNDIASVADARVIRLLSYAAKALAAEKNRPAIRQKIQSVRAATPGNGRAPVERSRAKTAKERLVKYGRVQDAAKYFAEIMGD